MRVKTSSYDAISIGIASYLYFIFLYALYAHPLIVQICLRPLTDTHVIKSIGAAAPIKFRFFEN